MADQLKKFMDDVESLPPQIRTMAGEIKELDKKVDTIMRDIKQKTLNATTTYKKTSRDQKTKMFKEVQTMYREAAAMSEKKVELATKMYDMVDENIRLMDKHVDAFNDYYKHKYTVEANKLNSEDTPEKRGRKSMKGTQSAIRKITDPKKQSKGAQQRDARLAETSGMAGGFKPMQIHQTIEMPANPSEPRYCTCHQVSFGEMVACDNKDCKYEWFHFQCVGLTSTPPGTWYCKDCRESMKKKKKKVL